MTPFSVYKTTQKRHVKCLTVGCESCGCEAWLSVSTIRRSSMTQLILYSLSDVPRITPWWFQDTDKAFCGKTFVFVTYNIYMKKINKNSLECAGYLSLFTRVTPEILRTTNIKAFWQSTGFSFCCFCNLKQILSHVSVPGEHGTHSRTLCTTVFALCKGCGWEILIQFCALTAVHSVECTAGQTDTIHQHLLLQIILHLLHLLLKSGQKILLLPSSSSSSSSSLMANIPPVVTDR